MENNSAIGISKEDALNLVNSDSIGLQELILSASVMRTHVFGDEVAFCGIQNSKSGACPEDCAFCSQSARHSCEIPVYPLVDPDKMIERAKELKEMGARAFSVVTSGSRIEKQEDIEKIEKAVKTVNYELKMECCASLGRVTPEVLKRLKDAGLTRYHHNLETAASHFENIVSTYKYSESIETIKNAQEAGLKVCSGGILGMGESFEQRVELADLLRNLNVDSVPLNFLNPRPGTKLENQTIMPREEVLRDIAMFRLMMPEKDIIIAGGREAVLGDLQSLIFLAGANAMMIGEYLTTSNRNHEADKLMIEDQGLYLRKAFG